MPFQNRHATIKTIAATLRENRYAAQTKQLFLINLITFSQCAGTGKTRVVDDFLEIFSCYENTINVQNCEFLENTILFYIDCSDFDDYDQNDNFNDTFFGMIYAKIFKALNISLPIQIPNTKLHHDQLQHFLKTLFIDRDIGIILKEFKTYQEKSEFFNDIEKVKAYIQSHTKRNNCEFIILSFDEVGALVNKSSI